MKKHIFSFMFIVSLALLPLAGINAQAATVCTINSFAANPTSVISGQSTTITIKTSNCTKTTLFGLNPHNVAEGLTVQTNGSVSSGPVASARVFTLEARKGTSAKVVKTLTVNVINTVATTTPPPQEKKGFFQVVGNAIGALFSW